MGHWGVRSYENDLAGDALDAALEAVHGEEYDRLMDDRNPLPFEQVQDRLLNPETLLEAVDILKDELGQDPAAWDELGRLALAGVVVRHAERKVPIPPDLLALALHFLQSEDIEWDEATKRQLRKAREIELLRKSLD